MLYSWKKALCSSFWSELPIVSPCRPKSNSKSFRLRTCPSWTTLIKRQTPTWRYERSTLLHPAVQTSLPLCLLSSMLTRSSIVLQVKLSDFYAQKTEIAHKTLNPRWDEDFTIEVSHDGDIMKHPLEIKCVLCSCYHFDAVLLM